MLLELIHSEGHQHIEESDLMTPFVGRVEVEQEELYLEEGLLTANITNGSEVCLFWDSNLPVTIRPIYTKTECKINFKYHASNRASAIKWRDNLRRRMSSGMQALLHEVIYHYSAPYFFYTILKEIHEKREAVAGYNEDFHTWLKNNFHPAMSFGS